MRGYYERSSEVARREEHNAPRHHEERHPVGEKPDRSQPQLHIFQSVNDWHVWLNTGIADNDGICLAIGPDRQAAVQEAANVAEAMLAALNGPPPLASRGPEKGPARARCRGMVDGVDVSLPACCERAGQYNGFASGPLLFKCPKSCPCHD
jgi:hypothetical protein